MQSEKAPVLRLQIKLSQAEKDLLSDLATKSNSTMKGVILKAVKNVQINEALTKDDILLLSGLSRNLNQLTKFAHQANFSAEPILEIVQQLRDFINARR